MRPVPKKPAPKTAWDLSAQWYDEYLKGDSYQARLILPNLSRLLRLSKEDRLLDLACGQGFFTRAFAQAGAKAVGVDASAALIKLAQSGSNLEFQTAPAHETGQPDQAFDKITCISAIQNIHNPEAMFKECARLLKARGELHLVMNHPIFRIPGKSAWRMGEDGVQVREFSGYLSEFRAEIQMHPGKQPSEVTYTYHRPLQTYFKWLGNAGLAVVGLEEWISDKHSDPGKHSAAENAARKEFPLFMYLKAIKL